MLRQTNMTNLILEQSSGYSEQDFIRYFESRMPQLNTRSGGNISVRCPFHEDSNPSFSVNPAKGLWKCFKECGQGGIIDFEERYSRCDRETAKRNVAELLGRSADHSSNGTVPEAIYEYWDAHHRQLMFRKLRLPGKRFLLQRPLGDGWVNNLNGIGNKPLYGLSDLITADTVLIAEGEKDCDNVRNLNWERSKYGSLHLAFVTNFDGAGRWSSDYTRFFGGKDVVIFQDNDSVGRKHAQDIARNLSPVASEVRIVDLPGLPDKGDISDFIQGMADGDPVAAIMDAIRNAPCWEEPAQSCLLVADEFLDRVIEPRRVFLEDSKTNTPIFRSSSINQIFAYRGIGKSVVGHCLLAAMLKHENFLHLRSSGQDLRAVLVDGELPSVELQERLRQFVGKTQGRLMLITPEVMPTNYRFPVLSQAEDQMQFIREIEPFRPDIVVFDSLASCFRFDTNDPDVWDLVNAFLRDLRTRGYCVLIMHHAGKLGSQRGRTDGDDDLDISIKLSPIQGWTPGDGIRFEWTYEKVRAGGRLQGFSAKLDSMGNWVVDDEAEQRAVEMLKAGQSIRAVAKESGLTKGKVEGLKKKWLM
jgi:hypothetical protein